VQATPIPFVFGVQNLPWFVVLHMLYAAC